MLFVMMMILLLNNTTESQILTKERFGNNSTINCEIGDAGIWMLYQWHFRNATTVNVILFLRKYQHLLNIYVSKIFDQLFFHSKFRRTFKLHRYKMNHEQLETYTHIDFVEDSLKNYKDALNINHFDKKFLQAQKIRRESGDPEIAYLYIAFDVEDLLTFLERIFNRTSVNPRGSFIIIFINPVTDQAEKDISKLLKILWTKYNILNVNVKMPCSVLYENNYKMEPFVLKNNEWGVLRTFLIEDAINNELKFINNLRKMQQYPVNVSIFFRRPTAMKVIPKAIRENKSYKILERAGGLAGVDGTVLAHTSYYLNFSVKIKTPPYGLEYGQIKNGTFLGSLGDVVYNYVIASFNSRFIMQLESNDVEFTYPVSNDLLCILVPKSEIVPHWMKITRCLSLEAWLGICGLYVFIVFYWYLIGLVGKKLLKINRNISDLSDSFLEVFALMIAVPIRKVFQNYERLFVAICMLFNIIFVGTFQGALYNSYTNVLFFPDINSLTELDKSGFKIITSSKSLIDAFTNDYNPVIERLRAKIVFNSKNTSSLDRVANEQNTAAFERKNDAKLRIATEYTRKTDGFETLHVIPECPVTYYLSYIVPKGSPYLALFNNLIILYTEAGLINKWNSDSVDALILENRVHPTEQTDVLKPFTLEDMQSAFYLVTLGLSFSVGVFIAEVLRAKLVNSNDKKKQIGHL